MLKTIHTKLIKSRSSDNREAGQTLIETIVAIFVLTTALVAGVGLAIYAFSISTTSQAEIVAANLAREGTEVVRMMRDSNWLASDAKAAQGNPTYDLQPCNDIGGHLCFPKTYQQIQPFNAYDLNPGNQRLIFDPATNTWDLDGPGLLNFDLYLQADGSYTPTANGTSTYARMVKLSFNFNGSYPADNNNSNGELVVRSIVAWRGKNCTEFAGTQNLLLLSTKCKIIVEEHLTNWKDYK